jgi:hypothetical protein
VSCLWYHHKHHKLVAATITADITSCYVVFTAMWCTSRIHALHQQVVGLEKRLKDAESARDRLEREKTVFNDRATRAEEEALHAQVQYSTYCYHIYMQ